MRNRITRARNLTCDFGISLVPRAFSAFKMADAAADNIDGPTERISSFLDHILQPIAQAQKSYLKDTTQFINFIEKRKVPKHAILVSMDVTSLYEHSSRGRN